MTLIELFNSFHDACRRVNLTSDARSLFLAYMQHWNAQRRPQAVDISLQALRETAKLDDESYRRAAICLSNLKFWRLKRKAHDKGGRFIYLGDFFLGDKNDRRENVAGPAISASPPTPPSDQEEIPPKAAISSPEIETEQNRAREKAAEGVFSVDYFRDKRYSDIPQAAIFWLQEQASPTEYDAVIRLMQRND